MKVNGTAVINNIEGDSRFTRFQELVTSYMKERIYEKMTADNLREIAKLLLEHGADPNAEHSSPVPGYTPLMLAAENDERSLFDSMLIQGGDPLKSYVDHRTGENINCWDIAKEFNSKNVLMSLEDIELYFKTN